MAHSAESQEIHLPQPTLWPMVLGLGLGLTVFGILLGIIYSGEWFGALRLDDWLKLFIPALPGIVILFVGVGGWLTSNIAERARSHAAPLGGVEASKFGMWCFIGTECVIFGGLIARAIYIWMREPAANEILHHPDSLLVVSINTFLLLTSSLAVVLGLSAIQRGERAGLARWMGATALLGAAFIGIQAYEYSKLFSEGITLTSSQFGSGFFMLTGFHGLHVFGGVIWALIVALHSLRGGFNAEEHMGVEIFGLYWHFVDVVWIFIFTLVYLLPSTPAA
jgi:cytochrome c oxidase subunit 3/cytochrome o ubiquinol oxidase subunit 3